MRANKTAFGEADVLAVMRLLFSLKPVLFTAISAHMFRHWHQSSQSTLHHQLVTSQNDQLLSLFRTHFLSNKLFSQTILKHSFRLVTQNSNWSKPNRPDVSNFVNCDYTEISVFHAKPTKMLSLFGGRGLMAWSIFAHGCEFCFLLHYGFRK